MKKSLLRAFLILVPATYPLAMANESKTIVCNFAATPCGVLHNVSISYTIPETAMRDFAAFEEASRAGDLEVASHLAKKVYPKGQTLLHYASLLGDEALITLLVKQGANINAQDSDGKTPLHSAVQVANLDSAKALMIKGADIDIADSNARAEHYTPLQRALFQAYYYETRAGFTPIIKLMSALITWRGQGYGRNLVGGWQKGIQSKKCWSALKVGEAGALKYKGLPTVINDKDYEEISAFLKAVEAEGTRE